MGTCLCCMRPEDLRDGCIRYCWLFSSCCSMYSVLASISDEHDVHASSWSQPSDGAPSGSSAPTNFDITLTEKSPVWLTHRNGLFKRLALQHSKDGGHHQGKDSNEDLKSQQLLKNGEADTLISMVEDEEICPTCLEGYDTENPKMDTKCGHHFHLACILEWLERSSHCPVCYQEMAFKETL